MTNPSQAHISNIVRGAADHLHVGARHRICRRRGDSQNVTALFEADIKIVVWPKDRGVGNVSGNSASWQSAVSHAAISGQNFLVDDIDSAVSVVCRGNEVQTENALGIGLHVHGVEIVCVWIKGHLSRLELYSGNKWNAGSGIHQVWPGRIDVRIKPAQAESALIARPQMSVGLARSRVNS